MLNVIAMAQNFYVCTKRFVKIIPSYFNNCCLSKVTNFNWFVVSQYYHRIYQIGTFCHNMKTTLICFLNYNPSLSSETIGPNGMNLGKSPSKLYLAPSVIQDGHLHQMFKVSTCHDQICCYIFVQLSFMVGWNLLCKHVVPLRHIILIEKTRGDTNFRYWIDLTKGSYSNILSLPLMWKIKSLIPAQIKANTVKLVLAASM